jgi:hypothetical protein
MNEHVICAGNNPVYKIVNKNDNVEIHYIDENDKYIVISKSAIPALIKALQDVKEL